MTSDAARADEARTGEPSISVVVASNRQYALLADCLASVAPQCAALRAELIVTRPRDTGDLTVLRERYPTVRFIEAPHDAGIPSLRGQGLLAASGTLVALTEDHCVPARNWLTTLARYASRSDDVVGGGMDNARDSVIDWGAYFSEYGFFDAHRPARAGNADGVLLITGANVAYHRRVVPRVGQWMLDGEWENVVHGRLAREGSSLRFDGSARVSQNRTYGFRSFCVDRYEHGLDYARTRIANVPARRRLTLLALSPALPVILTWRVARAAGSSRMATFVRALPATFAFLTAWSFGEAMGYLHDRG